MRDKQRCLHDPSPTEPRLFSIMGIVNITPDSFSDGGIFFKPQAAIDHALSLIEAGAELIDLGGESTRPGSRPVSLEEEWYRLAPVIEGLLPRLPAHCRLSVDTSKPEIMRRSLQLGVTMINNVRGLTEQETLETIAGVPGASYIAMHCHGTPRTMQIAPLSGREVISAVSHFFASSHALLRGFGLSEDAIFMDPGIGFGKTDQANLRLMAHTPIFAQRYNLVLGVSRKSWLGRLLSIPEPLLRDAPAKIAEFTLALAGAKIIRTHEVSTLNLLRKVFTEAEE